MFRPPGVVRLKDQKYLAGRPNPQGSSSLSKTHSSYKEEAENVLFDTTENIQHQGANPDEKKQKELEYKKKTERHIWLTMPTNKMYIRNPGSLISEYEKNADKKKQKEIMDKLNVDNMDTKKAKAAANKEQGAAKDKDGQSVKGEKGKKDDKANMTPNEPKKPRKTKIANEEDLDQEPNHEKHLMIKLDVFNPSKNKELHAQLYKDQLPHATKELKEFVDNKIKEMNNNNNSQDFNWVKSKRENWFGMVR